LGRALASAAATTAAAATEASHQAENKPPSAYPLFAEAPRLWQFTVARGRLSTSQLLQTAGAWRSRPHRLRLRLDDRRHDPAVLSDLAVADEAKLLVR
jgi:hypothetical protein